MQIRPTNNLQNTQSVNLTTQRADQSTSTSNQAPVDQLDLSTEAQMLTGGEIRADRVAQVKADITSTDARYLNINIRCSWHTDDVC